MMTTLRSPERSTTAGTKTRRGGAQGWRMLPRFLPSPTPCASWGRWAPVQAGAAAWLDTAPINGPTDSAGSSLCLLPTCSGHRRRPRSLCSTVHFVNFIIDHMDFAPLDIPSFPDMQLGTHPLLSLVCSLSLHPFISSLFIHPPVLVVCSFGHSLQAIWLPFAALREGAGLARGPGSGVREWASIVRPSA